MQTLPSEVFVHAWKVLCIKKNLMEILVMASVLKNVCGVSILQMMIMLKNAYLAILLVMNAMDLLLKNVTYVLHGPLLLKVKKVNVLCNAQKGIDLKVLTQLTGTLNSVLKIEAGKVVSILQQMLLIQPVLVRTVLPVVDLLKTNA